MIHWGNCARARPLGHLDTLLSRVEGSLDIILLNFEVEWSRYINIFNIGSEAIFLFNEPDFVVSQRRVRRVDDDDELDVGVGDVAEYLNEQNKQKNCDLAIPVFKWNPPK